jgi:phospholipid/cholesterol/gamma-HCH transport system ATP-binding protein
VEAVIELKGVVNGFGGQLVHDGVSLTMKKGEILGLVGGSGSGKSVLLRTILGLRKPRRGKVEVLGEDIYNLSEEGRKKLQEKWGVLFQDGALFSAFNVLDNIGVPLREHTDLKEKEIEKTCREKLEKAGLEKSAGEKMPSELSGGMVRRAALARAIALEPEILFLDEPTGGLDPVSAAALDELIASMRDDLKLSVLLITHDLDTIATVCDRIAMIVDKKIETGTLDDMINSDNPEISEFFNGPRMHNIQKRKKN